MPIQFTTKQIEELLAKKEYTPIKRLNKKELTKEERIEVQEIESVISFGQELIDLFDWMVEMYNTLPTQKQYVEAGINKMLKWLADNKPELEVTSLMVEACKLRLTRTYMSRVIELHLEAIIREYLPHIKIKKYDLMDSVMGVDLILEDDIKRYYVHVTSNTPFAVRLLREKEGRGGYKRGRAFIPYSRDFTNDLMLKYDIAGESTSTQFVNGFPLFIPEYIAFKLRLARMAKNVGEPLDTAYPKIKHFEDWAKHQLNIDINRGA